MQPSKLHSTLPMPVKRALKKLGMDIRDARKRRRISMDIMAERAMTSRQTLGRLESGDPKVSMGAYATVLFVLGMTDRLAELLDASVDPYVLDLDEENLPKRVRTKTRK